MAEIRSGSGAVAGSVRTGKPPFRSEATDKKSRNRSGPERRIRLAGRTLVGAQPTDKLHEQSPAHTPNPENPQVGDKSRKGGQKGRSGARNP